MAKKKIYWLSFRDSPLIKEKRSLLEQKGYIVELYPNLEQLQAAIKIARTSIIIISDNTEESTVYSSINIVANLQELGGTRFILAPIYQYFSVMDHAENLGFRDIIPLSMDGDTWLRRFLFSTSGKQVPFPKPEGVIGVSEKCEIKVPARVTWLSDGLIRFETRFSPNSSDETEFEFDGTLAKAFGQQYLRFSIDDVSKNELIYRFSNGITARFDFSGRPSHAKQKIFEELKYYSKAPRYRVFLAISNPKLRSDLLYNLDINQFDISVALLKHNIKHDPMYFSPQVMLIEDKVFNNSQADFDFLMKQMERPVPIVFIGQNIDKEHLNVKYPDAIFYFEDHLPNDISSKIVESYLLYKDASHELSENEKIAILPEHHFSTGKICLNGEITGMHPHVISFKCPHKIDQFSICEISNAELNHATHSPLSIKITSVSEDLANHEFQYTGYICNLSEERAKNIASWCFSRYHNWMSMFINPEEQIESLNPLQEKFLESIDSIELPSNLERPKELSTKPTSAQEVSPKAEVIRLAPQMTQPSPAVSSTPKRKKFIYKKPRLTLTQSLKYWLIFIAIVGVTIGMVWGLTSALEPLYEKSGSQFTESLKKLHNIKTGH